MLYLIEPRQALAFIVGLFGCMPSCAMRCPVRIQQA
jgi:hypothetical protein